MRKISVFNKKGGVGKSTISVQLAHGLTEYGHKVLLFDLDSQKNCSLYLGIKDLENTFDDVIYSKNPIPLKKAIYPAREGLYLLSNDNYEYIDNKARDYPRIDLFLEDKLTHLSSNEYDYIIIDTSPSTSPINNAVLYYVDELIVPIDLEEGSVKGLLELHKHLERLRLDKSLIKYIIPNKYRQTTNLHKEYYGKIKEIIGDKLLKPINDRIKIAEATSKGKTVLEYGMKEQFTELIRRVNDEWSIRWIKD